MLARAHSAQQIEIGVDDVRDFWVSSNRLSIDPEHDWLTVARDLNAPRTDRFRHHLAVRNRQPDSVEPHAHAVACVADGVGFAEEIGARKPIALRSRDNANRPNIGDRENWAIGMQTPRG